MPFATQSTVRASKEQCEPSCSAECGACVLGPASGDFRREQSSVLCVSMNGTQVAT